MTEEQARLNRINKLSTVKCPRCCGHVRQLEDSGVCYGCEDEIREEKRVEKEEAGQGTLAEEIKSKKKYKEKFRADIHN